MSKSLEVHEQVTSKTENSNRDGIAPVQHGVVEILGDEDQGSGAGHNSLEREGVAITAAELENQKGGRFGYFKQKQFWIVLLLSQVLAIVQTGTNTFTNLLADDKINIPAFQTMFNYVLLNLIFTSYTLYKYGWKKWVRLLYRDGWRFLIFAFFDVEGNYFTVLAYNYTTILSAQLINFWAIVVVLVISFVFLKVRYHIAQYLGIIVCCTGLALLVVSDHIYGLNGGNQTVKGDMFALVGSTCYGLSNVLEEFLVSKRPMYEVIGQLAFWGLIINGVQAAIFDRDSIRDAVWMPRDGGYLAGFTLLLTVFYSGAPIVFRMASAAFFNIGLLTGNFWGVVVGTKVFHQTIHPLYPPAFVLIMLGHFVYYGTEGVLGEAKKPWLGENQEGGDDGIGTARRQLEHPEAIV